MTRPLTVLIVGGYGTFGGRLARLLGDVNGLTLLIGGRSLARAQAFCARAPEFRSGEQQLCSGEASLGATAARMDALGRPAIEGVFSHLRPVLFDRDADLTAQLRALGPDVVVDASGPFQSYGDRPYRLVEACIECGIHYLDLADSAEFVSGIGRYDEDARARGVFVLSGVSSFPVLTAAVVRSLSAQMVRVDGIIAGIAPSPYANVGLNVIRAIAGYAGKPVRLRDGRVAYCFNDTVRYTIAPPGVLPLRPTEFSLVDVPDLQLMVHLWPTVRTVWMGAGPTPAIWHRLLRGFAWLVRIRLLPSLSWLASLMHWATNAFRWGEHRGGMFVRVEGVDAAGSPVARSWHLLAEGDAGPFIPSMACEAIIRKGLGLMDAGTKASAYSANGAPGFPVAASVAPCLAGSSSAPNSSPVADLPSAADSSPAASSWPALGARPALRELEVSDYAPLLARRSISFGARDDGLSSSPSVPLYPLIAGDAWHSLPSTIREMHSLPAARQLRASYSPSLFTATAVGRADITRGTSLFARLAASVVGFPSEGRDVPVTVRFDVAPSPYGPGSSETWTRTFANHSFSSEQFAGTGRFDRLLCERFGPITLALAVVINDSRLHLIVRGWTFLGIPLPRSLAPHCDAHESERNGFFHFDVAISHRWTGLIVHYRGWLVRKAVL
jgi:uncharacterized protein DUF4166/saccharopine dehydrogenase-like protein